MMVATRADRAGDFANGIGRKSNAASPETPALSRNVIILILFNQDS